jgi:hypothetical protein
MNAPRTSRWFQKSAVAGDRVYGLLNRFRLFGWCATDGEVVLYIRHN